MTDKRYMVGIVVTVFYVVALGIYAYVQRGPILAMEPNELGDALAGAASPLAFLWLVLGYLQQGDELRQNTEALKMQAQELHDSVQQQKALVTTTQLQHEFEIKRDKQQRRLIFLAKQPQFHASLREDTKVMGQWELTLKNLGHDTSGFDVDSSHESSLSVDGEEEADFRYGYQRYWSVSLPQFSGSSVEVLRLTYVDGNGERQSQEIKVVVEVEEDGSLYAAMSGAPEQIFPPDLK